MKRFTDPRWCGLPRYHRRPLRATCRLCAPAVALTWVALANPAVRAQNPSELVELARRQDHTTSERSRLEDWVRQQLQRFQAADPKTAGRDFRRTFESISGPAAPFPVTDSFRELLGDKCSVVFGGVLDELDAQHALHVAIVLARVPAASTVDGLSACLEHANPAVRYWGADGLTANRSHIVRSAIYTRRALAVLEKAAMAETSNIILRKIYEALDYTSPNSPVPQNLTPEVVNTVSRIVDARIQAYRNRTIRAVAADRWAVDLLLALRAYQHTPAADRPALLGRVGALLQSAAGLYLVSDPSQPNRDALLSVVLACEQRLTELVRSVKAGEAVQFPAVYTQLRQGANRPLVQFDVWKWVGTPDVPGLLNEPPLSAPVPPEFPFDGAPANASTSP